ncbi:ABC transporter permease [Puniceicoccaceae bacterium K14]|nr:ABC transporter permease [Puniceicoccaceae bacterium K14]
MKHILILLKKDISLFLKDKVSIVLTFIIPSILIFIVGNIFGDAGKNSGPNSGIRIAILDHVDSTASQRLIESLKAEKGLRLVLDAPGPESTRIPLTEERIRSDIENNKYRFALIIPEDATSQLRLGIRVKILDNPVNQIEHQIVQGLLQKTLFTNLPLLLVDQLGEQIQLEDNTINYSDYVEDMAVLVNEYFNVPEEEIRETMSFEYLKQQGEKLLAQSLSTEPNVASDVNDEEGGESPLNEIIQIERDQVVGKEVKSPQVTRTIGGYSIMFLLFAVTASANSLFEEKRSGIFNRLLSTPVQRTHILWSKFIFNTLLGLVQITSLYIAGHLMFGVDIASNFINLLIISVCAAAACTSFGMLLAAVSKTQGQAQGLATFIIMMMSSMGGAWWPVAIMPPFMQLLAKFTIVYWAVEGLTVTLWNGASFLQLLPYIGMLIGIAFVVTMISSWRFKRGDLLQ